MTADGQEPRAARCAACGTENRLPRVYCASCGARLEVGAAEPEEAARERRKRARRRKMHRRARSVALAAMAVLLALLLWPRTADVEEGTRAEAAAAGGKLGQLLAAAHEGRRWNAVFTEAEANAWLRESVRAGSPARPVRVKIQWRKGGAVLTLERQLFGILSLTQTHTVRIPPYEPRFEAEGMSVGHLPVPEFVARPLRERRLLPQWRAGAPDLFRLYGKASAMYAGDGWFALEAGRPSADAAVPSADPR